MAVLLLECREDEERQANFLSKEASSPVLETTASFTNGTVFNGNLMVRNNIIYYSFSVVLLVFILQLLIQRLMYKASLLAHVISVHSVNGPMLA